MGKSGSWVRRLGLREEAEEQMVGVRKLRVPSSGRMMVMSACHAGGGLRGKWM
jgi:hypothetical protein